MPEDDFRWIVLIQKSPKGPFTTEEIKTLLQKGVIRHTDVAVRNVPGEDEKKNDGWKFLWQYSEFDRRLGREEDAPAVKPKEPPAKPAAPPAERRSAISNEELERKVAAELPHDLWEVAVVEAVAHHEALKHRGEGAPEAPARSTQEERAGSEGPRSPVPRLMAGALACLGLYLGYRLFSPSVSSQSVSRPAPMVAQPESQEGDGEIALPKARGPAFSPAERRRAAVAGKAPPRPAIQKPVFQRPPPPQRVPDNAPPQERPPDPDRDRDRDRGDDRSRPKPRYLNPDDDPSRDERDEEYRDEEQARQRNPQQRGAGGVVADGDYDDREPVDDRREDDY